MMQKRNNRDRKRERLSVKSGPQGKVSLPSKDLGNS